MPRFDKRLAALANLAAGIARAGEIARTAGDATVRKAWTLTRLEALYELAYLRVFAAWEQCLECVFYRSLCGYASAAGQETLVSGAYYKTVPKAEAAILAIYNRDFLLWADPDTVIRRCKRFIKSGAPGCPGVQEAVISANKPRLENFAAIRHRIAHDQTDAKKNFDAAALALAGKPYAASRPGKLLRDGNASTSTRWLHVAIGDLLTMAGKLV
jgi:hypothetical protein